MEIEIPKEVIEFQETVKECERLYKGKLSDIGNFIYKERRNYDKQELLDLARKCLTNIRRGIPIK